MFSNINGLLDWEDFALKGYVKFPDYGLLIILILLFLDSFTYNKKVPDYGKMATRDALYIMVQAYWVYYLSVLLFSVAIQGLEWPIKMGRYFFYGWIFFLIFKQLLPNPIVNFEKIVNCLMVATLIFGLFYAAYNLLGWNIYPKGEQEVFNLVHVDYTVKRNFSGFPTFTCYFIFLFTHRLMVGHGSKLLNLFGLLLLLLCVLLMLTRGMLILVVLMLLFTIFYRKLTRTTFVRINFTIVALIAAIPIIIYLSPGHYEAVVLRFSEFGGSGGMAQSHNAVVRSKEFFNILKNVMDFNPFLGLGFTNAHGLGYSSSLIHGGSADNGFSNLIGTTGFIGLFVFLGVMFFWVKVNLKLQALNAEPYSKVNFIFIIYMLGSFMNGSSMSYAHQYSLFLAYDLLAYAYIKYRTDKELLLNKKLVSNKL
jgi:hypothetical protein